MGLPQTTQVRIEAIGPEWLHRASDGGGAGMVAGASSGSARNGFMPEVQARREPIKHLRPDTAAPPTCVVREATK